LVGLTTNSLTISEHKNLKTILFSPPLDGALYPLQPLCRERSEPTPLCGALDATAALPLPKPIELVGK
jgi:hypothetical protein